MILFSSNWCIVKALHRHWIGKQFKKISLKDILPLPFSSLVGSGTSSSSSPGSELGTSEIIKELDLEKKSQVGTKLNCVFWINFHNLSSYHVRRGF